jgi:isocitrate/isopropylmalate dehydrogenase
MAYSIAIIPGDGIGGVTHAAWEVLQKAAPAMLEGRWLDWSCDT